MVKKERLASAFNFGIDKTSSFKNIGDLGGPSGNKYGSQEAIYPPGHIEHVKTNQKSMQIEHAEYNMQMQFESSNSQVHIIDDKSSSQTG